MIEPRGGACEHVAAVRGVRDCVAFACVDHQLRWCADGLQRMPELEGLRRGAFLVAVADHDERRVVIDACAKEGNHPLVNLILAVVALPV